MKYYIKKQKKFLSNDKEEISKKKYVFSKKKKVLPRKIKKTDFRKIPGCLDYSFVFIGEQKIYVIGLLPKVPDILF